MIKIRPFLLITAVLLINVPLIAGERTIPVDIFLMIDKSLSMADPGKYDSMHEWVRDQLLGQVLIDGDWITVYQFYGKEDHLLSLTVENDADRQKIVTTINKITPDGQYTDIGLALDTIKKALASRGTNGRHKILLLLTDLKQEAPWTSRYAGSPASFDSPYLAEARIVKHDDWFEITLDMDIQDAVVKTTKELYSTIEQTGTEATTPREVVADSEKLTGDGTVEGTNYTQADATAGNNAPNTKKQTAGDAKQTGSDGSLPLLPIIVVLSGIVIAGLIIVPVSIRNNRKKKEQEETV